MTIVSPRLDLRTIHYGVPKTKPPTTVGGSKTSQLPVCQGARNLQSTLGSLQGAQGASVINIRLSAA